MRTWKLVVHGVIPPTANEFLRMPRLRRGQRKNRRRVYQNDLVRDWAYLLLEAGVGSIPKAKRRRGVKITRYGPGDPDPANLYTPADKLILDNLVDAGVLVDDNMTWLELHPVRHVRTKQKRTVIEVQEVA